MNRPFPAFAALLVLMTLAVVALSTSSRSTTAGPTPRRKAVHLQPPAKGGPSFVFVIAGTGASDEEEEVIEIDAASIGDDKEAAEALGNAVSSLQSTTICAVEPVSGITHDSFASGTQRDVSSELARAATTMNPDEMLVIFDELGARRAAMSWHRSSDRHPTAVAYLYRWLQSSRVAAAARLWLVQQLRRLVDELPLFSSLSAADSDDLEWSEYAELIDLAVNENEIKEADSFDELQRTAVRFGDWMRHSAAASLSGLLSVPGGR